MGKLNNPEHAQASVPSKGPAVPGDGDVRNCMEHDLACLFEEFWRNVRVADEQFRAFIWQGGVLPLLLAPRITSGEVGGPFRAKELGRIGPLRASVREHFLGHPPVPRGACRLQVALRANSYIHTVSFATEPWYIMVLTCRAAKDSRELLPMDGAHGLYQLLVARCPAKDSRPAAGPILCGCVGALPCTEQTLRPGLIGPPHPQPQSNSSG